MNLQMTYDLRNAEKALPARVRKSIDDSRSLVDVKIQTGPDNPALPHLLPPYVTGRQNLPVNEVSYMIP
jgi:hypothetical protein